MDYKKEIKEFIIENFLFGEKGQFDEKTDIFEKRIVDSTGVLEIICFIEESYNLTIDDDEVTLNNFSNIENIARFLQNKPIGNSF